MVFLFYGGLYPVATSVEWYEVRRKSMKKSGLVGERHTEETRATVKALEADFNHEGLG
jgi:chlorite dismutase